MMSGTGILHVADALTKIKSDLASRGLTTKESCDFRKFKKTINGMDGKDLSEQFRLNRFELYQENAFWVGLYDDKGACVSVHALRMEKFVSRNLSKHWKDQQKRIYAKPRKMGKNHAPSANRIFGKVCYSGDFFLSPDHRGGDSGSIVFMGFLLAALHFDPDWIYGLMHEKLANSGFASRCGYAIQEPAGTHWIKEPPGIGGKDWLVATNRENILHRAALIADGAL